jgi:hypothetical protein
MHVKVEHGAHLGQPCNALIERARQPVATGHLQVPEANQVDLGVRGVHDVVQQTSPVTWLTTRKAPNHEYTRIQSFRSQSQGDS